jgi:SAM-dependent methyltransferase
MVMFVPSYWPLLRAYHEVRESLYRRIIASLDLPLDALILDAGCGDCYYGRLLADVLGAGTRIVAVDRNPAVLPGEHEQCPSIRLCQTDLERVALRQGAFDAIWLCRALHSALDPIGWLATLVGLLRPGGMLVVIENDLAHYPMLSWPADFEQRIQQAHVEYMHQRSPDAQALARYYAARHLPMWLREIGLRDVRVQTHVSEDVAPMPASLEAYWCLVLDWLGRRAAPALSDGDRKLYARLTDADAPEYVLRQPGFTCMELTTVAVGRVAG